MVPSLLISERIVWTGYVLCSIKGLSTSIGAYIWLQQSVFIAVSRAAASVGGWVDQVVSYFVDLFIGVPHMVLLMLISFMLGGGLKVSSLALRNPWPNLTRVIVMGMGS